MRPAGVKGAVMEFLPEFLLRILRATPQPDEGQEKMMIIIRRRYAYLEAELRRTFEGQEDVKVIVDRRTPERPTTQRRAEAERHRDERRRPKERIVEVVISA